MGHLGNLICYVQVFVGAIVSRDSFRPIAKKGKNIRRVMRQGKSPTSTKVRTFIAAARKWAYYASSIQSKAIRIIAKPSHTGSARNLGCFFNKRQSGVGRVEVEWGTLVSFPSPPSNPPPSPSPPHYPVDAGVFYLWSLCSPSEPDILETFCTLAGA